MYVEQEKIAVVSIDPFFGDPLTKTMAMELRKGPLIKRSHKSIGKIAAQLSEISSCMLPGTEVSLFDKTVQLAVEETIASFDSRRTDLLQVVAEEYNMLAMSSAPAFVVRKALDQLRDQYGLNFGGQFATEVGIDDQNRFTGTFKPLRKRDEIKVFMEDIGVERLDLLVVRNDSDQKLAPLFDGVLSIG